MAKKHTFFHQSGWIPNCFLSTWVDLHCSVVYLGDYFSYQTYLLITRQGCGLLEAHVAPSSQPKGGVVQQQLQWGWTILMSCFLSSSLRGAAWFASNGLHVTHVLSEKTETGWLNPCWSCRVELLTQRLHKGGFR